jgi:hypothetical protein
MVATFVAVTLMLDKGTVKGAARLASMAPIFTLPSLMTFAQ